MSQVHKSLGTEKLSDPVIGESSKSLTRLKRTAHLTKIPDWLKSSVSELAEKKYRYHLLEERLDHRNAMIGEFQVLAHEAHEEFRQHIRNLLGYSLDPLGESESFGDYPLDEYPRCWPLKTLQGYFGEIFAGVIAEHLNPFNQDWEIPIFPFRHHMSEYHQLEMLRQTGEEPRTRPGRFGDDLLAFQRNQDGKIVRALVCESKCVYKHSKPSIEEAHEKASEKNAVPLDYLKLVEILKDYEDHDSNAREWVTALRNLRLVKADSPDYERYDLVSYVCGLPPAKTSTEGIPRSHPHTKYTGGRWLEAVETQLYDVEGLVEAVYQKEMHFVDESRDPTELKAIWEQVLMHVTPLVFQALVTQHCQLLHFDGHSANISVSSLPLFRKVLKDSSHIKNAFNKAGLFHPQKDGHKVNTRFVIHSPLNTTDDKSGKKGEDIASRNLRNG